MSELLTLENVESGHGEAIVIRGVFLQLAPGQSLALLGRNGVGKTTLLDTIIGVTRHRGGTIRFAGRDITRLKPEARAAAGIGWVPQERNIFKSLTVEENLTAVRRPGPWNVVKLYQLFPRLAERRRNLGSQLSGGEQQMLAIARALVTNPRILILDEATEGLAPLIRDEIWHTIRLVRDSGIATLLVDKTVAEVTAVADRVMVLVKGETVFEGRPTALMADADRMHGWLGV